VPLSLQISAPLVKKTYSLIRCGCGTELLSKFGTQTLDPSNATPFAGCVSSHHCPTGRSDFHNGAVAVVNYP